MSDVEILPTIVAKDAGAFADTLKSLQEFATIVHLDVSDGIFTNALSWPYMEKGSVVPGFSLADYKVEVHLMVKDPQGVGEMLAGSGVCRIIAQIEGFDDAAAARVALESWRSAGAEAGVSILAGTPLESVREIIELCDVVQVMSVASIGAQGAPFDQSALGRVAHAHLLYPRTLIAVDGGVSASNIESLARVGARRFAVGSAISRSANPKETYHTMLSLAESAIQ